MKLTPNFEQQCVDTILAIGNTQVDSICAYILWSWEQTKVWSWERDAQSTKLAENRRAAIEDDDSWQYGVSECVAERYALLDKPNRNCVALAVSATSKFGWRDLVEPMRHDQLELFAVVLDRLKSRLLADRLTSGGKEGLTKTRLDELADIADQLRLADSLASKHPKGNA